MTPGGRTENLDITLTAVRSPDGQVLGAACLINNETEVARIRQQQELRGEMSSEKALELHNSGEMRFWLRSVSNASNDLELTRQLAGDIVEEAAHLDSTIGGFLSGAGAARAASGT